MSDYPMLISNKLHSFRNFANANITNYIRQIFEFLYFSFCDRDLLNTSYHVFFTDSHYTSLPRSQHTLTA